MPKYSNSIALDEMMGEAPVRDPHNTLVPYTRLLNKSSNKYLFLAA
jgi:hypothetical protein